MFQRVAWIGILIFVLTRTAWAFTLQVDSNGTPVFPWADGTIVFDVNYSACPASVTSVQLNTAIDTAMAVWNSTAMTSLKLKRGDPVTTTVADAKAATGTQRPLIVCDATLSYDLRDTSKTPAVEPEVNNIPAVAQLLRLDSQGHIAGAVVYLNAQAGKDANIANVFAYYPNLLQIVLAHEIGHVLGLGHSADINALMYYDASAKKELGLSDDDVKGVTYLYPRHEVGGTVPFLGCGTTQKVGAQPGKPFPPGASGAAAAEFAMLLVFCAAVRRGIPCVLIMKARRLERV